MIAPVRISDLGTARPDAPGIERPSVGGKFLFAGDQKLFVRGVTYGTFRPGADGAEYDPEMVERDFAAMAANGINTIRVYTTPPRWLLDTALRHGLRVMVGLPWEQHIAFLDSRRQPESIEQRVRAGVAQCAGHPAVLCYAVGNEIPSSIVRWHGAHKIERFLARLCRAVKEEDPGALVTYVNYPSTEYLRLDFIDIVCFNVYLESQEALAAYIARLQNLAGDRPLLLAEIGLDSRRNGEDIQAETLDWQVRTAFAGGCAGAFVFSWTDEWHRGGSDIEDWDFGLTTRDRQPKPSLATVRAAFTEVPFPGDRSWPRISVVVCTYNGSRTIRDCLDGLSKLEYPDYEVIVVDDGSTDAVAQIVGEYDVRLIRTPNRGLGNARNTGLEHATGEIVAYTDDDTRPDPHWLTYLAAVFVSSDHAGVGGPNIAPPGDGFYADCVSNSPGNPVQVLLTDEVAEHIAGCNSAFRREALREIGGYDPRFRVAGDDVDVCWRLQERGWTIGFSPAAMVWHHRRNSLRAYWKQQIGYGRAEALLEAKWPEKYNPGGHFTWAGRLYGTGLTLPLRSRRRIYQGSWGTGLFQSEQPYFPSLVASLPLMPEWFLVVATLAIASCIGLFWHPLLLTVPLLIAAVGALLLQAARSGAKAQPVDSATGEKRWKLRTVCAFLHLVQPLARLIGRQRHGLTPWRSRGPRHLTIPWPRAAAIWTESWHEGTARLERIESSLRHAGAVVFRGGAFDRWDLECRGGLFGSSRLLMTIEEHGNGKQFARFRWWPAWSFWSLAIPVLLGSLAAVALPASRLASTVLGVSALAFAARAFVDCALATGTFTAAVTGLKTQSEQVVSVLVEHPQGALAVDPAE